MNIRTEVRGEGSILNLNAMNIHIIIGKSSLPPFDKESVLLILTTSIIQILRYDGLMINRAFSFRVKFMKANTCGRFRE